MCLLLCVCMYTCRVCVCVCVCILICVYRVFVKFSHSVLNNTIIVLSYCLFLNCKRAIENIRWSTCLLVWLLSSNKDLVFSGGDVPLGIVEHHLFCCHNEGHLSVMQSCMRTR